MRPSARTFALAAIAALPRTALAQTAPPPAQRLHVYSPYEQQTIDDVLSARGLVLDPAPEGKKVERVDVVTLPVFEKRDVLPQELNALHVTTRKSVIRDEVLLQAGQPYEQALADDTIRNLRRLPGVPQLSLVLVVAARGSAPDRVVVVVVTKDVWSLRLNWDVVADAGGIDMLALQPSETNFLGTHQILGATFVLEPSATTVGATYMAPHLGSSRIAVATQANVMFNHDTGAAEGTYGDLVAGEPLFSGETPWAWDADVQWQDYVHRRYENAQLSEYLDPSTGQRIPFDYRFREYAATYEVTRSFGWDVNHDFTLAAGVSRVVPRTLPPPPGTSPQTVADFQSAYVPLSDTRVGPSLQYHTYRMRFVRVVDFDTLGLQEDYRLGHDVVVRVFPSLRAFGSTRDVVGFYGAAQYTWAVRDGLLRVSMASTTEPEPTRIADASLQPTAHLVSPTLADFGRIVVDGTLLWRWRNYLNQTEVLGNESRLRGYPTNFLVGDDLLSYNVEFRTRPVEVFSMELGGVAFYDVGDAFSGPLSNVRPYQSVGVGLRTLFPWLDRTVFQADIGVPVERPVDPSTGARISPFNFVLSFGQAFVTPTVAPQPVLPTGQGPDSP